MRIPGTIRLSRSAFERDLGLLAEDSRDSMRPAMRKIITDFIWGSLAHSHKAEARYLRYTSHGNWVVEYVVYGWWPLDPPKPYILERVAIFKANGDPVCDFSTSYAPKEDAREFYVAYEG